MSETRELDVAALSDACAGMDARSGATPLFDCLRRIAPDLAFRHAAVRDEWYQPGGVVDADGNRVADSLEDWVARESGGDVMELVARHGESGYWATAITGTTGYLTAPTGEGLLDFVQIEVDRVQEVLDRPLFVPGRIFDSLEDVIDPLECGHEGTRPLGPARYEIRSVVDFAARAPELTGEYSGDPRFRRFLDEWAASSAGAAARFSDHWVLRLVPYQDANGDHRNEVRPLGPCHDLVAGLRRGRLARGAALAETLRRVDREAGFPMAWYFLMLTENYLPYPALKAIHATFVDPDGGPAFLPAADLAILSGWIDSPYHL